MSLQKQVELQIYSNEILAISREAVHLNCSNQAAQEVLTGDGHSDSDLLNHIFCGNAN